jgi:hypothetical protein
VEGELSPELIEAVEALAQLDDEEFWCLAREAMSPEASQEFEALHFKQRDEGLDPDEDAAPPSPARQRRGGKGRAPVAASKDPSPTLSPAFGRPMQERAPPPARSCYICSTRKHKMTRGQEAARKLRLQEELQADLVRDGRLRVQVRGRGKIGTKYPCA